MAGISPVYVRLASTVCSVAVLAANYQWLSMLPSNALGPLLLSIATLIALSFIGDKAPETEKLHRFPATDWKSPLPTTGIRDTFPKYEPKDPAKSFTQICDSLIKECTQDLSTSHELPPMEKKWIIDMLEYNVKGGKMNRGLMVVQSGEVIIRSQGREPSEDDLKKLAVLGWCIEWLQAWLLVADDFMDSSQTRRGQLCWYKKEGVEEIAINDAFLIEMLVYRVLKRHFWTEPYYVDLLDLFMETTFQTECGQLLDLQCKNIGLEDFTYKRWELIVKYKTAFYSFYLPVALGMAVAGIKNQSAYDAAREPLLVMGVYFQAQDDYLDAFAPPETLGKIGTDIQDKKCGWLFVQAYHDLCTPEQKAFLDEHYGKCKVQTEEEKKIKAIYEEIGLQKKYEDYEQKSFQDIMAYQSQVVEAGLPWEIIEIFLKKVYKRALGLVIAGTFATTVSGNDNEESFESSALGFCFRPNEELTLGFGEAEAAATFGTKRPGMPRASHAACNALLSKISRGEDAVDDAKKFLSFGCDVPDGLVVAALGQRARNVPSCPNVLRLMLEKKANPNAVDPLTQGPAIHSACWHGSVDVVKMLLDFKADLEAKEPKMETPPLNTALAAGNAPVCLELLNRNADVQWKHHDGATALHVATAWIASSHNSNLRIPPMGEEPRAVIAMMLHNGVDPTQTEGMSKGAGRSTGMTPLESFRREIARSPWRTHEVYGRKFDQNAKAIHTLLEQAEEAVKHKATGNKAFQEKRHEAALEAWQKGRETWEKADVRGHHVAVLWSNEAVCRRQMGDLQGAIKACEEGRQHFTTPQIQQKLDHNLAEAKKGPKEVSPDEVQKKEVLVQQLKEKTKQQKEEFKEITKKAVKSDGGIYGEQGSAQKDYVVPGPFICPMKEAQDMGLGPPPEPKPWWEKKDADSDEEPERTKIGYLPAHHPNW
ncbi:unnamed protein product [Effrenium voratum]|nr:unnamed protein product [Effrenium voratum]